MKDEEWDDVIAVNLTSVFVLTRSPHNHNLVLGHYWQGGEAEVKAAVDASMEAAKTWAYMPWEQRAAIFLKAAELMAGPYRYIMNARRHAGALQEYLPGGDRCRLRAG